MTPDQYKEIWIDAPDGQSICALINGDMGWMVYFRWDGDAGFGSRNPDYEGAEIVTIDYVLSNGQQDEYPASWALPVSVVERALEYFRSEGKPAPFVSWHNESGDGVEIRFAPE